MKEYCMLYGSLIAPQDIKEICDLQDRGVINSHGLKVISRILYNRVLAMLAEFKRRGLVK